jgi:hypothetical protein
MDGNHYTPPTEVCAEQDRDDAELQLLARLHYALAAVTGLCSLVAAPFVWAGNSAIEQLASGALDQYLAGVVLLTTGIALAVLCLVHAGVLVYVGRLIRSCRRWWLVMIFSGLHTINIPLGTALSIYTFTVLGRESVKKRFRAAGRRDSAPNPA